MDSDFDARRSNTLRQEAQVRHAGVEDRCQSKLFVLEARQDRRLGLAEVDVQGPHARVGEPLCPLDQPTEASTILGCGVCHGG